MGVLELVKFAVKNYRSIRRLEWSLGGLSAVIGPNDSGKTNLLLSLQVFLESRSPQLEDFHLGHNDLPMILEGVLGALNATEVDALQVWCLSDRVSIRRAFVWDPTEEGVKVETHVLRREPKNSDLKPSRFEENRPRLKEIVQSLGLPPYFLSPAGNVTQDSFRTGLDRYLREAAESIEWEEPAWVPGDAAWRILRPLLPEIRYVPAVQELSRELGRKTPFDELLNSVLSRIAEGSHEIGPIRELVERTSQMFARGPEADNRLAELREFETRLSALLREGMPDAAVEVDLTPPTFEEILGGQARVFVDDGFRTPANMKGHGLQRELMFAILRAYISMRREGAPHRTLLFAIEEPELYLHPFAQRRLAHVLTKIADKDQVVYCTHSPIFVNMENYRSICVIRKPTASEGSSIHQCMGDLFPGDERSQFKMAVEYDPERSEMFFARKVLLVEGDTEKIAFPLVASKMGIDLTGSSVAVVEAGGKSNLPLFMRISTAFGIPTVVVHDVDPGKPEEAVNARIEAEAGPLTQVVQFDPDFEGVAGVPSNWIDHVGKRMAAYRWLHEKTLEQVPPQLRTVVDLAISV